MKIIWKKLNNHDANGVITQYKVCYKVSENPADISCNLKQLVDGNTTEVVLNGLFKATTYNVAVQVVTAQGFGPLGPVMTGKTLEDGECSDENYHTIVHICYF